MLIDETAEPISVSLSLLENITNCFSDDQRIGSGGFAVVYKVRVTYAKLSESLVLNFFPLKYAILPSFQNNIPIHVEDNDM
jgi:hypothetical protein